MTASATQLRGTKVLLREKRIADASDDYAWSIDRELSRLDAAHPLTLSFNSALALYEEEIMFPQPRRMRFGIDTLDGAHIGNCMYYDINEAKGEAELGIMIGDRRYWGKGYGTDAVATLLRYIFTQTGLKRVYLHTLDWNARAQKSFVKAGFTPKGTVRKNGHSFIFMEISRQEWEHAPGKRASEGAERRHQSK